MKFAPKHAMRRLSLSLGLLVINTAWMIAACSENYSQRLDVSGRLMIVDNQFVHFSKVEDTPPRFSFNPIAGSQFDEQLFVQINTLGVEEDDDNSGEILEVSDFSVSEDRFDIAAFSKDNAVRIIEYQHGAISRLATFEDTVCELHPVQSEMATVSKAELLVALSPNGDCNARENFIGYHIDFTLNGLNEVTRSVVAPLPPGLVQGISFRVEADNYYLSFIEAENALVLYNGTFSRLWQMPIALNEQPVAINDASEQHVALATGSDVYVLNKEDLISATEISDPVPNPDNIGLNFFASAPSISLPSSDSISTLRTSSNVKTEFLLQVNSSLYMHRETTTKFIQNVSDDLQSIDFSMLQGSIAVTVKKDASGSRVSLIDVDKQTEDVRVVADDNAVFNFGGNLMINSFTAGEDIEVTARYITGELTTITYENAAWWSAAQIGLAAREQSIFYLEQASAGVENFDIPSLYTFERENESIVSNEGPVRSMLKPGEADIAAKRSQVGPIAPFNNMQITLGHVLTEDIVLFNYEPGMVINGDYSLIQFFDPSKTCTSNNPNDENCSL